MPHVILRRGFHRQFRLSCERAFTLSLSFICAIPCRKARCLAFSSSPARHRLQPSNQLLTYCASFCAELRPSGRGLASKSRCTCVRITTDYNDIACSLNCGRITFLFYFFCHSLYSPRIAFFFTDVMNYFHLTSASHARTALDKVFCNFGIVM